MNKRQSSNNIKQSRGFTLIELLVVIAIISLLVSILLPSLNRAKKLARKVVCQSNVHQQAYGFRMYANNWKNKIPKTAHFDGRPLDYWYQALELFPVKATKDADGKWNTDSKIFCCPSDPTPAGCHCTSYGLSQGVEEERFYDIPQPSGTGMVMDAIYVRFNPFCLLVGSVLARAELNHNEGVNVLFADLHVGWENYDDLHEGMFSPDPND